MLPVLIDDEVAGDFNDTVRRAVQILVGASDTIPEWLVDRLTRTRRVLVILDHFSEFDESTDLLTPFRH
jgi:hypothetical protein